MTCGGQGGVFGLEDEVLDVTLGEEAAEGRVGDEGLVLVAPGVARVLELLLHDPDHDEGHVVDHHRLAHRVVVAEEVLLELVAQEQHAPAPVEVHVVDVAPARGGHDVAHGREDGAVGRDLGGETHLLPTKSARAALELPRELGLGDLPAQGLDVLDGDPDAAALAQPLPGQGGAGGKADDDVLAQAVLALHDVLLEPLAERHQQRHGHRAPGDAEQGEGGAQLLVAHVLEERAQEGKR